MVASSCYWSVLLRECRVSQQFHIRVFSRKTKRIVLVFHIAIAKQSTDNAAIPQQNGPTLFLMRTSRLIVNSIKDTKNVDTKKNNVFSSFSQSPFCTSKPYKGNEKMATIILWLLGRRISNLIERTPSTDQSDNKTILSFLFFSLCPTLYNKKKRQELPKQKKINTTTCLLPVFRLNKYIPQHQCGATPLKANTLLKIKVQCLMGILYSYDYQIAQYFVVLIIFQRFPEQLCEGKQIFPYQSIEEMFLNSKLGDSRLFIFCCLFLLIA